MDAGQWGKLRGGYYAWEKGHVLLWNEWGNPEDRPLWPGATSSPQEFGQAYADWMLKYSRNLCLYPNVYIMDQFGSQIRHFRPDLGGPDRGHHLLHRAEGRERRGAHRADPPVRGLLQRQRHGHPGRPGGVPLLPEDLPGHRRPVERHEPRRQALDRRARTRTPRTLGLDPVSSGVKTEDEGLFLVQHGYWKKAMRGRVEAEAARRPGRRPGNGDS